MKVFQLCHVVLGLRPLTRKDEGQIVRGWLEREDGSAASSSTLSVGSVWHLISMDWWTAWQSYVSHQDSPLGSSRSSGAGGSDLVSNRGRGGSRKTPSLESTLASDSDKNVIATSYQQLSENQVGDDVGR